ncbi:MAG: 2-oxopent-4-enoate hydratase [Gammaproteobacteria bacterium]|nr:2-oxopent-4-enoate hydratase [Gammaproteobacteria bacterium]
MSLTSLPAESGHRADFVDAIAAELYDAWCERRTVEPLRDRYANLSIDDAYAISLRILARRIASGEQVIGKKIGVTSKAVQDMLGVHQPDFGFLTNAMQVEDGGVIEIGQRMIQPRAEAEIALILGSSLSDRNVTESDVLAATESIAACFEIVDSRINRWDIKILDTIADNASCGLFVLGKERLSPRGLNLAAMEVRVKKNGHPLSSGFGSAVQGSPLAAVAWLANTLGHYGVTLNAGDIILSGSLVPLEPAQPGDIFSLDLDYLGVATVSFI